MIVVPQIGAPFKLALECEEAKMCWEKGERKRERFEENC